MDGRQSLKDEVYTFLKEDYLGILASVNKDGMPHVTPLYCLVDENLNLYFTTNTSGAKYCNITERPNVAMTFVNNDDMSCVQLRGQAMLIENTKVENRIL